MIACVLNLPSASMAYRLEHLLKVELRTEFLPPSNPSIEMSWTQKKLYKLFALLRYITKDYQTKSGKIYLKQPNNKYIEQTIGAWTTFKFYVIVADGLDLTNCNSSLKSDFITLLRSKDLLLSINALQSTLPMVQIAIPKPRTLTLYQAKLHTSLFLFTSIPYHDKKGMSTLLGMSDNPENDLLLINQKKTTAIGVH